MRQKQKTLINYHNANCITFIVQLIALRIIIFYLYLILFITSYHILFWNIQWLYMIILKDL